MARVIRDTRGRKGTTEESDARLERLADLVGRYSPGDSLIRAAVDDYEVRWERIAP